MLQNSNSGASILEVMKQEIKPSCALDKYNSELNYQGNILQELPTYQMNHSHSQISNNYPILQELPTQHQYMDSQYKQASNISQEEQKIQHVLMPGMEQKNNMEQQLSDNMETPIIIKVKRGNYGLSLAILLIVLLVGFIYYSY